jgi:hypothetical protein
MSPAYVVVMLVSVGALFYLGMWPREVVLLAQKSVAIFQ